MNKQIIRIKQGTIRWTRFTRHSDAVFRSLGREISIGVLSVATLLAATPASATARMATAHTATANTPDACTDDIPPLDVDLLEEGDLLFTAVSTNPQPNAASQNLSNAIASVTQGFEQINITHVAILHRQDGQTYALEASSQHGVWLNPIDDFISQTDKTPAGLPMILVGRLKDRSNIQASVSKALIYLGRPYDNLYSPTDSAIYCSELVQLSYTDRTAQPIFPLQPMSFHDSTGRITPFWTEYYKRYGMTVPEGKPGTNPGALSRSNKIEIIYNFQERKENLDNLESLGYPENLDSTIALPTAQVTASIIPAGSGKEARLVQVLSHQFIQNSAAQSVNDLLKLVAGVDVRQRGPLGVQTDIGVNGGNEDQLTVMLNGVNISNPHTGHLTFDLPVTPDDIERIEVIEGGASRVYGSSAFSGVINIVTKSESNNTAGIHLQGGSYGTFGSTAHINLRSGAFTNRISGGWTQSDGASANSDMKRAHAYWNERYSSRRLDLSFQAGVSNMRYGANTFYGTGSNSQYEADTRYLLSLQGEVKGRIHLLPQIYWNRSSDHYIWLRNNPSAYENYHLTTVYGGHLNAWTQWALGKTAVGIEYRRENILSTRLGRAIDPNRINHHPGYKYEDGHSNVGIYVEHDIEWKRWSLSAGLLAHDNSSVDGGMRLYPGIDIACNVSDALRLFASFNQSLRTPTYTDLYYNGPGLEGNSNLRPEKSTDYSVGASYGAGLVDANLKAFYRKGTDMIDWVKPTGASVWTTANSDIDNYGVSATVGLNFQRTYATPYIYNMSLSYCYNHQRRVNEKATISFGVGPVTYANQLVYLRHKFVATMRHRLFSHLSAQWELIYKDRTGWFENAQSGQRQSYGSFPQLDLRLQWDRPNYQLYAKANNITSHRYYDYANIEQPGVWFTVGGKLQISW
ncbi:MAG: TonB-dependent receptor [Bacteroidaceae bacterium]|nr:TonB-dependent receptor [Bacteroidaceae bacterium]